MSNQSKSIHSLSSNKLFNLPNELVYKICNYTISTIDLIHYSRLNKHYFQLFHNIKPWIFHTATINNNKYVYN